MLFLDGVYVEGSHGSLSFRWVKAPTSAELTARWRALQAEGPTQASLEGLASMTVIMTEEHSGNELGRARCARGC